MRVIKNKYHIRLETPNGAGYSIPTEVVRGIMNGEIEQKYSDACEFLNAEDRSVNLNVDKVRKFYEENV